MKTALMLCITILGLIGCSERKPDAVSSPPDKLLPGESYEIVVANKSKADIYPVLTAGEFRDDLGVVGNGAEKCEGFVPFKIGWEVIINWQVENLHAPTQQVKVTTAQYTAKKAQIKSLQFCYQGGSNWIVNAYDGVALGAKIVDP